MYLSAPPISKHKKHGPERSDFIAIYWVEHDYLIHFKICFWIDYNSITHTNFTINNKNLTMIPGRNTVLNNSFEMWKNDPKQYSRNWNWNPLHVAELFCRSRGPQWPDCYNWEVGRVLTHVFVLARNAKKMLSTFYWVKSLWPQLTKNQVTYRIRSRTSFKLSPKTETILLTFRTESNHSLIGCGIDSEKISRFYKYMEQETPLPHVFSKREVSHILTLKDRAIGLCVAFCCKEAFFKATDQSFVFPDCEFFYHPDQHPDLSFSLPKKLSTNLADCQIKLIRPNDDEIMALAYLFGKIK